MELHVFDDNRGYFFGGFNQRRFSKWVGVRAHFVTTNIPHLLGILCGLHYQIRQARGKLARVVALDCAQMGLAWLGRVREVVRGLRPGRTVNAAIYIVVDEPSACQKFSMHINADASGLPAEEARKIGTMMIHYLSDYVFDGAQSRAYQEQDRPGPVNLHGHRKLAGEQAGNAPRSRV